MYDITNEKLARDNAMKYLEVMKKNISKYELSTIIYNINKEFEYYKDSDFYKDVIREVYKIDNINKGIRNQW